MSRIYWRMSGKFRLNTKFFGSGCKSNAAMGFFRSLNLIDKGFQPLTSTPASRQVEPLPETSVKNLLYKEDALENALN